jgi:hypothetical protein
MLKTATELAEYVLEKVALRRAGKEVLKKLKELGVDTKEYFSRSREDTLDTFAKRKMEQELGTVTPNDEHAINSLLEFAQGASVLSPKVLRAQRRWSPVVEEMADPGKGKLLEEARRSITGRHSKLQSGEFLIGQSGSAEIANKNFTNHPFLFRGNTPDITDYWVGSRHPDVAAGYATDTARSFTPVENIMRVYRRKGLLGRQTAADTYGVYLNRNRDKVLGNKPNSIFTKADYPITRVNSITQPSGPIGNIHNPTYETVVPPGRQPGLLGEYAVREVADKLGNPAFALRRISGETPERIFAPWKV